MAERDKQQVTATSFDPKAKSFSSRADAFIADAQAKHGIIITKDAGRTAAWQQKYHVAHMFLYNKYQSTTPSQTDPGKRTISWKHFSNPKIVWDMIQWSDFLRTKTNSVPKMLDTEWVKGFEPDQESTEKHVKNMLTSANIGNNGMAMVSSGLSSCGEPCKCKAGRSNHLSDAAADLNSAALTDLTNTLAKLEKDKAIGLDGYLKQFGLHRPLVNHSSSPEKWHIEAIDDLKL